MLGALYYDDDQNDSNNCAHGANPTIDGYSLYRHSLKVSGNFAVNVLLIIRPRMEVLLWFSLSNNQILVLLQRYHNQIQINN